MIRITRRTALAGLAAAAGSPFTVRAQDFPNRPIRIVSPFAAGSVSDVSLRVLADRLGARMNGQVIIDNQPRAGGITAATAVLSSPPDGYTLALLSSSTAISVSLFKALPYDPVRDFAPITSLSNFANVLATRPGAPFASMVEFIAAAKAKPGTLNVGTSIVGSTNHLATSLLKSAAGIDIVIVPFRGPSDMLTAVIRGDVDVITQSYGALRAGLAEKQIRALGITTAKRPAYAPQIPTVAEGGVPGFEVVSWNGLFAPAATPPAVIKRLHDNLVAVLAEPDVAKRLTDLGLETMPSTPDELGARMKSEISRWAKVIADAKIEKQ